MARYAHCPELMEHLSSSLWLKLATSTVIPMCLRILGKRSIPSDRAAVRVVIQKPTIRGHQSKRIPSWMSKHPVFLSNLKQINHQYPDDPFAALADFKIILEKARKRTVHELLRKTPDSLGAKLLTASTALRAFRNRHLGILMRCCEACEPVGKCFDPISFECIDFYGLSQIIESLTRERITKREAEIDNFSWTQTEKDNALAKCRLGLRAWCSKKPMLCFHAVTDEDGHPLENEDESGRRLCEYWCEIFQAHIEGVQKAPDDIRWEIDRNEFDELMAAKIESAPGPDGIPYSLYRCVSSFSKRRST